MVTGRTVSQTPGQTTGPAPPDSHSTSSGTSDMSDYIETLSLSSHSSSDIPDSLRYVISPHLLEHETHRCHRLQGRPATTTLRPRSGREYQNRAFIETDLKVGGPGVLLLSGPGQLQPQQNATERRGLSTHYPGIDKCESPSPGYMSGSPGQEPLPR